MGCLEAHRHSTCRAATAVVVLVFSLLAALAFLSPAQAAPPELGWSFPPAGPLRVHIVRGYSYYGRDYRIEEALARAGANLFTESTQQDREAAESGHPASAEGGWLARCADPAGCVMDHHLVIVSAISAAEFGGNQQVLVDFVQHGGSVLFLCGANTFGDQSDKAALASMVPLEFPDQGPWKLETEQVSQSVELKPGPDFGSDKLPGAVPEDPPRIYSYYKVKPKPGAKVLLVAGEDQPILIVDNYGQGRVAVFAATCRGYPKQGQTPYWRWDGWPALLAETQRQIAPAAGDAPHGLDAKGREVVLEARGKAYDLLDGASEAGRVQFRTVLRQAAHRCHGEPTARFLLDLVAQYPLGISNDLGSELGQTLASWVDEDAAPLARALLDSGDVGKTILGLIVLGGTGAADARSTLQQFYATGTARKKGNAEFSLAVADPGTVGAYMRNQEDAARIRRAAVMGLGLLGDPAALPVLHKAAVACAAEGSFKPNTEIEALEPEHCDYQNALLASLLCGDAEAAEPVVDFLLRNLSIASQTQTEETGRRAAKLWQQQLYRRLTRVPDSVLPALAKRIAAEKSRNVTAAALAVFGGKKLSPEIASMLGESSVAPVAELGKRRGKE